MNELKPTHVWVLSANLFLAAGAAGFALIGIHFFLNRSTYPHTVSLVTFTIATVVSVALGFGLLAALETKLKILLALCSSVATFYFVEVGLRVLDPPLDRAEFARSLGFKFDERTQLQVVRDARSQGIDAFPLVSPQEFLPAGLFSQSGKPLLPLSGISQVTTVWCNEGGQYFTYRSDQHGFNNPPEAWIEAPQILLVGDSFPQGACTEASADIGNLLRAKGHSVLNLGMGGSGPLLELAILREYAEAKNPRFTFWFYYEGNDLQNLNTEMASQTLQRYLEQPGFSQGLRSRQDELDDVLRSYFEERFENKPPSPNVSALRAQAALVLKLTNLRSRLSMLRTEVPANAVDSLGEVLAVAKERLAEQGSKLMFVYLPAYSRYAAEATEHYQRDRVLALVRALEIPVLDFHETVSRSGAPMSFFPLGLNGHYNSHGYRRLAEDLERFLTSRI